MKKIFRLQVITILTLIACTQASVFSQNGCIVTKDSLLTGPGSSRHTNYYYDGANRIIKAERIDSGNTNVGNYDTLYYNGSGEHTKLETYERDSTGFVLRRTVLFTYASGKVSRVDETGNSFNGSYGISHDVTYDGNGNFLGILVDTASLTGNVDFPGGFGGFTWQNGNTTTGAILIMGDTLELSITYDTKNCIRKKLYYDGASALFLNSTTNNMKKVALINDENLGDPIPAGTALLDHEFTYNGNNDVDVETDHPALFDKAEMTLKYSYDCSSGITSPSSIRAFDVYPNPANDLIHFDRAYAAGVVKIFDMQGKEIRTRVFSSTLSSLNVSELQPGLYYIEIAENLQTHRSSFLKN